MVITVKAANGATYELHAAGLVTAIWRHSPASLRASLDRERAVTRLRPSPGSSVTGEFFDRTLNERRRKLRRWGRELQTAGYDLPNLRTPPNDVAELKRVLVHQNSGFEVNWLVDPITSVFQKAITDLLTDRRVQDTVLLYYSGHGKLVSWRASPVRLRYRRTLTSSSVGVSWIKEQIDSPKPGESFIARLLLQRPRRGGIQGRCRFGDQGCRGLGKGKFDRHLVFPHGNEHRIGWRSTTCSPSGWCMAWTALRRTETETTSSPSMSSWIIQARRSKAKGPDPKARFRDRSSGLVQIARRPRPPSARAALSSARTSPSNFCPPLRARSERETRSFFLAAGCTGSGPLSTFELIKAVGGEVKLDITQQSKHRHGR